MRYCKEFKEQTIKLSDEIGVKQACAQLGPENVNRVVA